MTETLEAIAIIGMSGRFPGARNLEEFWPGLCAGRSGIRRFSDEELRAAGVGVELLQRPDYVKAGVLLEEIDRFDAQFFGMTPREAEITDPQHRIFLECVWEALDDAGCDPSRFEGPIGVFASASLSVYLGRLLRNEDLAAELGIFQIILGCDKDFMPLRTAFKLNLRGPAMAVQTACSSSLAAVHLGCQSLLNYQTDLALAGGSTIGLLKPQGYVYQRDGILSPDGHCRAFDARAQGTVGGSGAGVVALRRLSDALEAGDPIRAVIKSTAVNNDGARKIGYTAPSVEGQSAVIREALALAGVKAETIGYVEAHGTGTALGDPVEAAALKQAFGTERRGYCGLGSLKSNIGHLDAAAGIAGLIKTVLSLENRVLAPTLDYESPNPEIDFENSPFYVNAALRAWEAPAGERRRAGVSSFGIGGTNAHAVLEESPEREEGKASGKRWHLLTTSARSERALEEGNQRLADWLEGAEGERALADAAYTLQTGRKRFEYRQASVVENIGQATGLLRSGWRVERSRYETRPVVFIYPGQGSQRSGMGLGLYRAYGTFRREVDRCRELLGPMLGEDLLECWAGPEERLAQTRLAQPALFVYQYAMSRQWMSLGIKPSGLMGHSLGEWTAACVSGVMDLESALSLVVERGRRMEGMEEGAMLAIWAGAEEIKDQLEEGVWLAASNGPEQCVVSGTEARMEEFAEKLRSKGLESRRLKGRRAFHSGLMEPMVESFVELVSKTQMRRPQIPYIGNVRGAWVSDEEAMSAEYWGRQLREPVLFGEGLKELAKEPERVLLEIGPGRTLRRLMEKSAGENGPAMAWSQTGEIENEDRDLTEALGRLWMYGVEVDWKRYWEGEERRKRSMPGYAFQRERYWLEEGKVERAGEKKRREEWFYTPSWKRAPLGAKQEGRKAGSWLIWEENESQWPELGARLKGEVRRVRGGARFRKLEDGGYEIDRRRSEDYRKVLEELIGEEWRPEQIVHLGSLGPEADQEAGFYSLLYLAQAIGDLFGNSALRLTVATKGVCRVESGDQINPLKATILGPVRVINQEYPNITCRCIDLSGSPAQADAEMQSFLEELFTEDSSVLVARRGSDRWVQSFEKIELQTPVVPGSRIRENGVYLITGGLGGLGLVVGRYLAGCMKTNLILVGRSTPPPREEWDEVLERSDSNHPTAKKIEAILAMEAAGSTVTVLSTDIADPDQARRLSLEIQARFGALHGVFHLAGVPSGKLMQILDKDHIERVMRPKVDGTLALEELCREFQPDFIVAFSSLSALLGGVGQADYCAANAFLDAYATRNPSKVISINWDAWRDAGMAAEAIVPKEFETMRLKEMATALSSEEGVAALDLALASGLPNIIVSTRDLAHRISTRARLRNDPPAEEPREQRGRPDLSSSYAAPSDDLQQCIVEIWESLLGVSPIGVNDDFFELGGHSLLATQVLTRIRNRLSMDLPLSAIFEFPTAALLGAHLLQLNMNALDGQAVHELLDQVQHLTEEEARRLLDDDSEKRGSDEFPRG